jgi:uncharacterized protein YoxC
MASDVTREEHNQLVGRVDVLEREVDGEKIVTRHILEQTRRNSDDLAAIKTRLDRVEAKVEGVEANLTQEIRKLGTTLQALVRNLPKIVSNAVRKASPRHGK